MNNIFCEIYHADEKKKKKEMKTAITKNSSYGFRIDGHNFCSIFLLQILQKI